MERDALLTYPNCKEIFKIHTNARAFQLGAIVSHKDKPVAFYSRKITDAHQRSTVMEIEILNIVETLKEFRTILLGQKFIIYTYHKNLTCRNLILIEY